MAQTPQDTYNIAFIENGIVTVDYTFAGLPTETQRLAGLPLDDEQALTAAISEYGRAYKAGLEQERSGTITAADIGALQNKNTPIEGE